MNEFVLVRIIHMLCVVLWIGGIALIATVLLPVVAKLPSKEKIEFFKSILKKVCHTNTLYNITHRIKWISHGTYS